MARTPKPRPTPSKTSPATITNADLAPTAAELATLNKLFQQQNYPQLQLVAKTLMQKHPAHPLAWLTLGQTLSALEQWEEAQATLEKALQLAPQSAETLAALGRAHLKQNQTDRALHYMEQALAIDPNLRLALIGMSRAFFSTGNFERVIKHCEHLLKMDPTDTAALVLRSTSLGRLARIQEALHAMRQALTIAPDNFDLNNNIANLYLLTGEPAKAEEHYRKAWKIKPDNDTAFSNLFVAMHYNPAYQASDFFSTSLEWEKHFRTAKKPKRADTQKVPDRKIRIGLISGGFRSHPVGQMITSALQNFPDNSFELYAYTTNDKTDSITRKIQQTVNSWQLIEHLSQQALAERIRHDQIDILIDLNGPGEGSCYKALANEPAPILIKWVGSLINTTGLRAFDYLLSDNVETPEGSDSFYCEKLIRMPDDYICYCPPEYTPPQTSLPALVNGYVTFGCLNNPAKLNRQLLAQWAELLRELPNSRLLLKGLQYEGNEFCESIRTRMARYGITADRLILEGPANHQDFLATYNRIDIALDTWPYSGGLTTCEAMLMGVPVVTMPGPTFAGRHSATHLINAGMPELVTHNWDEYRQRVIGLATDLPNLAIIRACLRTILLQSPVCDGPRFGKHLTTALRAIWQRHCEDKAPAALYLDKEGQAHFEGEAASVQILPIATQTGDGQTRPFQWNIEGQIITLDNGALLAGSPQFADLQQLGTFATITFDPTGKVSNAAQLQESGELHHYPHVTLGDGHETTLFACLDPAMSATLEPLPVERQLPGNQEATQVITKLPITTLRLDDIEGLESIDWLLLDNLNDSLAVLENGETALNSTLLVQARVNFAPTHKQQPELTQISHWLSRHGFSFYRLNNLEHYSHLPARDNLSRQQATQLTQADALFIPNASRMAELRDNQLRKLAFVLHTAYGIQDLTSNILSRLGEKESEAYLSAAGFLPTTEKNFLPEQQPPEESIEAKPGIALPEAPFMSNPERELFKQALGQATQYFEFGSGGSTVWAVEQGLTIKGVESDEKWVDALKSKLGGRCQIETVDIGPTGDWGYPLSLEHIEKYPNYSKAIEQHETAFDLILVDGRFRVACTVAAIKHIIKHHENTENARIFIHDFWDRPQYHSVLDFLETIERVGTAGLFKLKDDIKISSLDSRWSEYARQPA